MSLLRHTYLGYNDASMRMSGRGWKAALWCAYLASLGLGLEAAVRLTGLERRLLAPLLYYQHDQIALHRPSKDPARIFELRPGTRTAGETTYTVNSLGFRDRERTPAKPAGVKRIVFLGGSTTFGAGVNDNETYPARLQRLLDRRSPGRFEVWNAGVCAYVLSQEIALAEEIIERYAPDLLVFQYLNQGRRAFLLEQDPRPYLRHDPALYLENLRFFPPGRPARRLFRHSAFWRAAVIGSNRLAFMPRNNPRYDSEADSVAAFEAFLRAHAPRVPILLLSLDMESPEALVAAGARSIDLFARRNLPDLPPSEIFPPHPPACAYRWYAEVIARELAGLVPGLMADDRARSMSPRTASPCGRVLPDGHERAVHLLDRLTVQNPRDAGLWLALCDAALRRGDVGLARTSLERAADLKPARPALASEIARLKAAVGKAGPASPARSGTGPAASVLVWLAQAEQALAAGDAELARELAGRVEAVKPSDKVRARLFMLYEGLGESSKVLESAKNLPDRAWRDPVVPLACAGAAASLGRRSEALAFLARAHRLPFSEEAALWIAQTERKIGEGARALDTLRRLLDARPRNARAWVLSAEIDSSRGDCAQALASLDKAEGLLSSPGTAEERPDKLRHRMALSYQACRGYARAVGILEGLSRRNPGTAVYRNDLGVCRYLMGRRSQAMEDWRAAIKLDPKLLPAYESLAAALESEGRRAEALALRRAIETLPPGAEPRGPGPP